MQITKQLLTESARKPLHDDHAGLPFGMHFTDHMFTMEYQDGAGWVNPTIKPYQPLLIDPAANILHYCQQVFEGQKAYRSVKSGKILLFRPQEHAQRFNRSLQRLCIPPLSPELYLEALYELLRVEQRWVPDLQEQADGASLYIRPTIIGTESALGVRTSSSYLFYIILSPVGRYFANGLQPISLWVSAGYVRAAVGGVGEAKTGGNYAASLMGGKIAKEQGCEQVLWLDAREYKYVEEGGGMNIFFVIDGKLVTPALSGSILPGITRRSVLELAEELGIAVEERLIAIDEVVAKIADGSLSEAFCTGTAVVVTPVGKLSYKDHIFDLPNPNGIWSQRFYNHLVGLQCGEIEDTKGWMVVV